MKLHENRMAAIGLLIAVVILALFLPRLFRSSAPPLAEAPGATNAVAQVDESAPLEGEPPGTNAGPVNVAPAGPMTGSAAVPIEGGVVMVGGPSIPGAPIPPGVVAGAGSEVEAGSEEIQLSFQGANIEMVVQWLANTTGKSVVKHPRVQCQLSIVSSRKLSRRDAINLVYRALALEGFTTIESSQSILIVPDGQEPQLSPEFLEATRAELPEGRRRLVKIFPLAHVEAGGLRDKVRALLSEKATIEVADRSNQLIVTDYTENIGLLGELIKELDVPAGGDTVIEFFELKHAEAEELGNLLTLIVNAQPAPPSSPSGRPGSSAPRNVVMGPEGMPMPPGAVPSPGPQPGGAPGPASGAAAGAQAVRIWPDKTANRLIVAAPKSKMTEIQRLIETLDTEKPRDVSIRVISLRKVGAEDLVKEIGPMFQKMGGQSLKEAIEVAANSRANSLIVLSSESNFKAVERLVTALDTEEAQEKTMRAFPLQNADAEDVAKQLQELNQDQDSTSRFPYYIFSSSMGGGRSSRKPTFVADRRRNTVIVQASPLAIEDIAALIEQLDAPVTDDSLAPRIFRLRYVSAVDIEDVLNELFAKRQQQRSYWDDYYYSSSRSTSDGEGGRLYGKIRITSEAYANAIIVTANSPEHLSAVEEVLKQLDVPSHAGETTLRLGLRFAKAATVANNINILFAKGGSPPLRTQTQPGQPGPQTAQQQQLTTSQRNFELEQEAKEDGYFPWLGGSPESTRTADGRSTISQVSDLVGRVRVVPDTRSNALLISANVHLLPQVVKLVEELDAPTAQVLIEAKIVEVSTDAMDKLGVRWSPDGSQVYTADDLDNSLLFNVQGRYADEFGGSSTLLAESLNSLRSGVIGTTINVDLLVQFLRKTTDARVLATPQINVADNELGKLFVGQQVPFIDRSLSTDVGGLNQSFSYKDVGVILEVTPHINTSGDVALKVRTESSAIVPGQTLFGGAILDTRNFKTDVTVKSGETLVLGGIIQKQISNTIRKTPVLGDIPGLGWAFKKKDAIQREVELMVFLRPKVVRTPEEARELFEEIERKSPLIKQWRDEAEAREQPTEAPASGTATF
jgi:type II secretion system protein D